MRSQQPFGRRIMDPDPIPKALLGTETLVGFSYLSGRGPEEKEGGVESEVPLFQDMHAYKPLYVTKQFICFHCLPLNIEDIEDTFRYFLRAFASSASPRALESTRV